MSDIPVLFFKLLDYDCLPNDGKYFNYSENPMIDPIIIEIKDEEIYLIKNNEVIFIDEDEYDEYLYSHYFPYNSKLDIMECCIKFEYHFELFKVFNEEDGLYHIYIEGIHDTLIECFWDENNKFHIKNAAFNCKYMSKGNGWKRIVFPKNSHFDNDLSFEKDSLEKLKFFLNYFLENEYIRSDRATERGFSFDYFFDADNIPCWIQNSSVATEARIWFGRKKIKMTIENKEYDSSEFEDLFLKDKISSLYELNPYLKSDSIIYSSTFELNKYHVDLLLKLINNHKYTESIPIMEFQDQEAIVEYFIEKHPYYFD